MNCAWSRGQVVNVGMIQSAIMMIKVSVKPFEALIFGKVLSQAFKKFSERFYEAH